jgi:SrtB family sortase
MMANGKRLVVAGVSVAAAAAVAITAAFLLGVLPSGQVSLDDADQPPLFSENPASAETKAIPKVENATVTGPTKFDSADDEQRYRNGEWHYPGELRSKYSYTKIVPNSGKKYIAGELLVEADLDISDEQIASLASKIGSTGIASVSRYDAFGYMLIVLIYPDDTDIPALAEQLPGFLKVKSAEPSYPMSAAEANVSAVNDPLINRQSYLNASGFRDAWNVVVCNQTTTIAVLDSGVKPDHEDLVQNVDVSIYRDFTSSSEGISSAPKDPQGHGTVVCGIVGATAGNGTGIAGSSHNATIIPLRVLNDVGDGDTKYLVDAMNYLIATANIPDVINMSLESDGLNNSLQEAINVCSVTYGIVCVAAVGNNSKYDETGVADSHSYPAACDNVIGVASVDSANNRSAFSRVNSSVDICAQGEKTYSTTDPSATLSRGLLYDDESSGDTGAVEELSGTSFAAPQVAAAAALLKAQNPTWQAMRIAEQLVNTTTDFGEAGRDDLYGYGMLNVAKAVGYTSSSSSSGSGSSSGSISPFTGANDGMRTITQEQADAHTSLQATEQKDIPATLARLMAANPDICAWVRVEGTNVSLPIARRTDNYYLDHGPEGDENPLGCPYLSSASRDFDDVVTVVYGHSFTSDDDYAFNQLHLFEDYGFFCNHNFVSVYLPGRKLEYEVIGAYLYTSRSIESVGRDGGASIDEYFGELNDMNSSSFIGYKRRVGLDPGSDRILQLSTCTVPANESLRYVVTCRYVCEEPLE